MAYITVQEYQDIIWANNVNFAQITILLSSTTAIIDWVLGWLEKKERDINVEDKNIFLDNWVAKLYTRTLNITNIIEVNETPYSWNIEYGGKFNDIIYIDSDEIVTVNSYVKVKVESWYETIPDDIKLLQAYLIKDSITQMNGGNLISKKIGDKSISYSENTWDAVKWLINSIFKSYSIQY